MSLTPAQIQQRREAGRKGGKAAAKVLKARYGADYFTRLGVRGGRPTWREALAKRKERRDRQIETDGNIVRQKESPRR